MRYQTGLQRKPPEGELLLILIGRKRWDFKISLGKTRVQGVFPKLFLKSHPFLPIRIKGNSPSGAFLFNPVWNLTFYYVGKQKDGWCPNLIIILKNVIFCISCRFDINSGLSLKLYLKSTPFFSWAKHSTKQTLSDSRYVTV